MTTGASAKLCPLGTNMLMWFSTLTSRRCTQPAGGVTFGHHRNSMRDSPGSAMRSISAGAGAANSRSDENAAAISARRMRARARARARARFESAGMRPPARRIPRAGLTRAASLDVGRLDELRSGRTVALRVLDRPRGVAALQDLV